MLRKVTIAACLFFVNPAFAQYKLYEEGLKKYNNKDYYGAIETLSDFLTRPVRDKKFDVDAYYWRGMAAFKLNDYTAAAEDLKQSLSLKHGNIGNIHWFIAKCYENEKLYNDAVVAYSEALKVLRSDKQKEFQILTERSGVYAKMGNNAAAMADLQSALAIQPGNESVKNSIAMLTDPKSRNTEVQQTETKQVEVAQNQPARNEPRVESKQEPVKEPVPVVTQPVVTTPKEPTLEELFGDEKRYALIIGNSAYSKQIGVLKNPVNDATDFAEVLKTMNFDVTLITDASYGKIRAEMMKFRDQLNQGERDKTVGLFFYAGHGLQHDNENYIVPVDAEIMYEDDISRFCFPIQKMVLAQMEMSNSRMNIVILDACRNNPFPALHRSIGESTGLGEMKKARGAFIAYATSPGSVASDGTGRNGLYTQELIKAMSKPGRTIEQVFKEVRANVLRQSGDRQNPWENSNIIGDFYFKLK